MTRQPDFTRRQVFVDTAAYFAAADARESDHHAARRVMERLARERWHLYTTNFIVAESHALFLAGTGRVPALRFLHEIDDGATIIVRVSATDERRARGIIEQYDDNDFSLTDATSFAVMKQLRIAYAFTFDSNFRQFGVQELTAEHGR